MSRGKQQSTKRGNKKTGPLAPSSKAETVSLGQYHLYAFWRYDSYPYVLGGIVNRIDGRGLVSPIGYTGMWFKPLVIVTKSVGQSLMNRLVTLRTDKDRAQRKLDREWLQKVEELLSPCAIKQGTLLSS